MIQGFREGLVLYEHEKGRPSEGFEGWLKFKRQNGKDPVDGGNT